MAGQVRVILLIEDSVRYYSRFLPVLYKVVMRQTQNLLEEELVTETYKLLSIRARPKILLASSYEEALVLFNTYEANLLTVITDLRFPRGGLCDEEAGFDFLKMAKTRIPDLPILVQSSEPQIREKAYLMGASFADKNSESLEMELAILSAAKPRFRRLPFLHARRQGNLPRPQHERICGNSPQTSARKPGLSRGAEPFFRMAHGPRRNPDGEGPEAVQDRRFCRAWPRCAILS